MKILVVKPFKTRQGYEDLISVTEKCCGKNNVDLRFFDYCMDDEEYPAEPEKVSSNFRIFREKREFTELGEYFKVFDKHSRDYDIVVSLDLSSLDVSSNYLTEILKPFQDTDVNMSYGDFNIRRGADVIPYFHHSFPSPLQNYPLFAFRGPILKEATQNLPQVISQNVLSKHIPKPLVTIYEESK